MAKTSDKARQAKCKAKLKEKQEAYQAYLEKDRLQKKLQRQKNKTKPITEQEAHKEVERVRIRNYHIQKKKTEQPALAQSLGESPYQTKQSTGRAMKRVAKSLPNSPRKKWFVIAKMAEEVSPKVKGIHWKVRTGISPKQIDIFRNFLRKTRYHGKHQVVRTGSFHGKFSAMVKPQKRQLRYDACLCH